MWFWPELAFGSGVGGGVGIGLPSGRRTLLQLDLAIGNEGLARYPVPGLPIESPLIPAFGLSFRRPGSLPGSMRGEPHLIGGASDLSPRERDR